VFWFDEHIAGVASASNAVGMDFFEKMRSRAIDLPCRPVL
jgi:hypothetical protein